MERYGSQVMRHYRLIDWTTQGYALLVAVLILAGNHGAVPGWRAWLAAHLGAVALVHLLIRASAAWPASRSVESQTDPIPVACHVPCCDSTSPIRAAVALPGCPEAGLGVAKWRASVHFLREFYPVLLYAFFYRATGSLNQLFHAGYLDPTFHRLDEQLFGFAPAFRFMAAFPSRVVSEILHAAYFSYYLMIGGVALALYLRHRAGFRRFVFVVSFVFYVCYLIYVFVPVVGPRIYDPELSAALLPPSTLRPQVPEFPDSVRSGPFFQLMAVVYDCLEAPGAAFPSSHVAVALVTVSFSFRYLRRVRWVHLVAAILLCLATVYGRYHYAVDVIAGVATTAVLLPLGHWLFTRLGEPGPSERDAAQTGRS